MINRIFDGISVKLHSAFGDDMRIYGDEDIEQGFDEPCFFIALVTASQPQIVGLRYYSRNSFDIHYFSGSDKYVSLHTIASRLFQTMEYITLDSTHRSDSGALVGGTKMRSEIIDGTLHFFVDYNLTLVYSDEKVMMEDLKVYPMPEMQKSKGV